MGSALGVPAKSAAAPSAPEPPLLDASSSSAIPKVMWKTGPFELKDLHEGIHTEFERIRSQGFEVRYLTDQDAAAYILQHFSYDVYVCFMALRPGAFKADLFRYCAMFKHGGFYSDLRQVITVPLDTLVKEGDKIMVPVDFPYHGCKGTIQSLFEHKGPRTYQIALMAAVPGLPVFEACIRRIVDNVMHQRYPDCYLSFTGPKVFGEAAAATETHIDARFAQLNPTEIGVPRSNYYHKFHPGRVTEKRLKVPFTSGSYSADVANREVYDKKVIENHYFSSGGI